VAPPVIALAKLGRVRGQARNERDRVNRAPCGWGWLDRGGTVWFAPRRSRTTQKRKIDALLQTSLYPGTGAKAKRLAGAFASLLVATLVAACGQKSPQQPIIPDTVGSGNVGAGGSGGRSIADSGTRRDASSDGPREMIDADVACPSSDQEGGTPCGAGCSSLCASGHACRTKLDCDSGACMMGVCAAATCVDAVMNDTETDVDCGGTCPPCADAKTCKVPKDCVSSVCTNLLCRAATCADGVRNGAEADVDCGGTCTKPCAAGQRCNAPKDCRSGACSGNICACPPGMVTVPILGAGNLLHRCHRGHVRSVPALHQQTTPLRAISPPIAPGTPLTCPRIIGHRPDTTLPVTSIDWCDAFAFCRANDKHLCGKIGGGTNAVGDYADATKSEWFNACSAQGSNVYPYSDTYNPVACNGLDAWNTDASAPAVRPVVSNNGSDRPWTLRRGLPGHLWDERQRSGVGGFVRCSRGRRRRLPSPRGIVRFHAAAASVRSQFHHDGGRRNQCRYAEHGVGRNWLFGVANRIAAGERHRVVRVLCAPLDRAALGRAPAPGVDAGGARQERLPMASLPSHVVAALALGTFFDRPSLPRRVWVLGAACAMVPDADVIGFSIRGSTTAICWGIGGFRIRWYSPRLWRLSSPRRCALRISARNLGRVWLYLFLATASHGVLDAFTDGGLGVAFFAPLDESRYFFPVRPIRVSPIDATRFFAVRGLAVLASEMMWIWLPAFLLSASTPMGRRLLGKCR